MNSARTPFFFRPTRLDIAVVSLVCSVALVIALLAYYEQRQLVDIAHGIMQLVLPDAANRWRTVDKITLLRQSERITEVANRSRFLLVAIPASMALLATIVLVLRRRMLAGEEHVFRGLAENIPDNIARYTLDARCVYINEMLENSLGMPRADVVGKTPMDRFPDGRLAGYQESILAVARGEGNREMEICMPGLDGTMKRAHMRFVAERDERDRVTGVLVVGTDVTERHRVQEAILASEREFRLLAESLPDGLVRYDLQCRVLYVNPALATVVAGKLRPVLGQTPSESVPGNQDVADYQRMIEQVIATGEAATREFLVEHPSGGFRTHHIRCVAAWDPYGDVVGALVIGRDITERVATERTLRETNANLAAILDAIPDMLVETDLRGTCLQLWPKSASIQATHGKAMLGRTFSEIMSPDDAEVVMSSLREAQERGVSFGKEVCRSHSADVRWFELSVSRKVTDEALGPRFIILFRVITERKRLEADLRKREEEFRVLAENSPDPMFRYDREGRCIYVNSAVLALTQKPRTSWLGTAPAGGGVAVPRDAEHVRDAVRQVLATGARSENNVQFISPQGRAYYFHNLFVPEFGPDGMVTSVLCVSRDITAMKEAERELGQSRDRLRELAAHIQEEREAERRHLAHEFHEDLAQVLAALRMAVFVLEMQFGSGKKAQTATIEHVVSLVDRAIGTVRDLASELGPIAIDQDLLPALERLLNDFRAHEGLHCELRVSEDAVVLDEKRATAVFRIVQEALNNISRHAQAQRVLVTLERNDAGLELSVRDDGKGFDPHQRDTRSFGLIGMSERAETLGGRLELSSAPRQGTTIRVRIPVADVAP